MVQLHSISPLVVVVDTLAVKMQNALSEFNNQNQKNGRNRQTDRRQQKKWRKVDEVRPSGREATGLRTYVLALRTAAFIAAITAYVHTCKCISVDY